MYPLRNIASAEFTHADYWSEAEHEVNPCIVFGAGLQECNGTCNKSLTALGLHMRITNPRIVCGAGLLECNGTCNKSLTALVMLNKLECDLRLKEEIIKLLKVYSQYKK